jgi:predicted amidohydrolase
MGEGQKLKISLIQMDVAFGDPEENRKRAGVLIQEALKDKKKPDVLVLPEMWNTGYDLLNADRTADRDGSPTIDLLREAAKREGVNIVAGSIADKRPFAAGKAPSEAEKGEGLFNSSYIIDREGRVIARYDKVHRFRPMDEDKYLQPGKETATFELDGVPCGVVICYDIRFPEFVRKLALDGARVLFVPAQWPKPREIHWKLLNIVRAIENQFFVVAVNRVGRDKSGEYPGMSMVVDPWGEVLIEGDDREDILTTTIDLSIVDHVRGQIPVFGDRRPELY